LVKSSCEILLYHKIENRKTSQPSELAKWNKNIRTICSCASSLYACVKDLRFRTCMEGLGFDERI